MNKRRVFLLIAAILAYLCTGIAQVGPGERAVVRRFGQVVAKPGPGLWIGLPWGIDRVDRVSVFTIRQLAVGFDPSESSDIPLSPFGQFLTGDHNLINGRFVVDYLVDDSHVEDYLSQREVVEPVLRREVEVAAAEWIARNPVDGVLASRPLLARWLNEALPGRVEGYQLGISIQRITLESISAPEEVRDAFEQVNKAQTAIRTQRNEAQQEAERMLSDANAFRFRMLAEAESTRNERIQQATADAESFRKRLEQYTRLKAGNPDILATIWREEIGRLLGEIKSRTRIELLDDYLGPNGLELNTFIPAKRK